MSLTKDAMRAIQPRPTMASTKKKPMTARSSLDSFMRRTYVSIQSKVK